MRMCRYAPIALVFLLAIACSASGRQPAPPGPSDIVATVGAVSITLAPRPRKLRAPILPLLNRMHAREPRAAYLSTLKAQPPVRMSPEPPRAQVAAGTSPAKGAANAPIALIAFADFQGPCCRAVSP